MNRPEQTKPKHHLDFLKEPKEDLMHRICGAIILSEGEKNFLKDLELEALEHQRNFFNNILNKKP